MSSSPDPTCPGLCADAVWDDASLLRGELYTREHLNAHAADLARSHGKPFLAKTPGPLRKRFARGKQRIHDAYQILGRAAKHRREPSPAEEWLLDNASVVQEQLREIAEDLPFGYLVELPRLARGPMQGFPRVYGLCVDYLRHTDGRVDVDTLAAFVQSYQSVDQLTIGELWAVPIMLRLGLILIVGALAASEASAEDVLDADTWAERLLHVQTDPVRTGTLLLELERSHKQLSASFLVQLLKRLREADTSLDLTREWLARCCAAMGTTPDDLKRREHLRQAADQVSVGNAITSMRAVSAMDWDDFFDRTSGVEAVLRRDPNGAYTESDKATRDRFRHAVEDLARRSRVPEVTVAERALARSLRASESGATVESHVGFHLVDLGRAELERELGYRPRLRTRCVRALSEHPNAFYFGMLGVLTLLLTFAFASVGWGEQWSALHVMLCVLALLPASEIALALVNALVVSALPPRRLAKLDFSEGIPDNHRTLVVVPVLVDSTAAIEQLIEDLEVRALANPDPNLKYALLSDFSDASAAVVDSDVALLERLQQRMRELNQRQGVNANGPRFWLLHRRRVFNPSEGCYMGWERKRGKLEELNRLLRGAEDTTFDVVEAQPELFATIKYVITLDADTELPRDVGARLVGCMAHPLNAPQLDPKQQRVVRGHAILQPRVGTLPQSARRTRYSALLTGPSGIDPYTTAVSDTYQDLFGEGSFVGKGLHHVDAFKAALDGRTPENWLLSHDLFEGIYARSALVTDIEVLDEQPTSYAVHAGRQHRWIRGDWQLLPWLLPKIPYRSGQRKSDLRAIDYWKVCDNLRRSLLAPALVCGSVVSWFLGGPWAQSVCLLVGLVYLVPVLARLVLSLVRESTTTRPNVGSLGGDLKSNGVQTLIGLSFTFDQAWVAVDAMVRSLYRMAISRRKLLEWTTMQRSARESSAASVPLRMWVTTALCGGLLLTLILLAPGALPFAAPLLVAWAVAPALARWLSAPRPRVASSDRIGTRDRQLLEMLARKTWRFFEEFVTERDNHLPPDNYQQDPRGELAHRTSPTNIGLYMLSVVSARDLGFITLQQAHARLHGTLSTLEGLPKYEGHILNWYDTETLHPLEPQYVSTVDSGNLAAYLWTLNEACQDLVLQPLGCARVVIAVRDSLRLARAALSGREGARKRKRRAKADSATDRGQPLLAADRKLIERELSMLDQLVASGDEAQTWTPQLLGEVSRGVERLTLMLGGNSAEAGYWLERARLHALGATAEFAVLAPWLLEPGESALKRLGGIPLIAKDVEELTSELHTLNSVSRIADAEARVLPLLRVIRANLAGAGVGGEEDAAQLFAAIETAAGACRQWVTSFGLLGRRALVLADGMNFRFLFDERRELFTIGYNVSSARLDPSHYDLLASEARLASLFAIAKGDIPQSHWFRLARPRARSLTVPALLSWSGSMFEYLMPLLCTRNNHGTLLSEAYDAAIERQQQYASERGVPWGVSESAYNVMDLRMTYQYRAFGVPGLGLKSGLGDDLVIAPYATILSGLVQPEVIGKNLRALQREGLEGPYGLYESIDYTAEHVPPGRRGVVVKAFMAHHQGMSLVAIQNILLDGMMQQRFHRAPRIKATELLLEERVPQAAPPARSAVTVISNRATSAPPVDNVEHLGLNAPGPLRMQLLGHGELSALIGTTGIGVTRFKGMDVGRFREDQALDAGGTYVYVRNRSRNRFWSAAYMPTRRKPTHYNVAFAIDRVEFHRKDGDVQTVMEVSLSPEHPVEVRRITLRNQGKSALDLEVTTYSEVVLAPHGADVAHRAFGNLFVETEALPSRFALLARRRPRLAGEAEVWMVQMLVAETGNFGALDFESSRTRFLGRGRDPSEPAAIVAGGALSQQTGTVLDPVLALRRAVRLAAGDTARVTLTTGLASSREEALALIETYSAKHAITRAIELGWAGSRVELRHLGVSATEVQRYQRLLSATMFPSPVLRGEVSLATTTRGMSALWAQGVSGDLPIVVCRIDHSEFSELSRELLLAHEYWRLNGYAADLVFIHEEPSGYLQPTLDSIRDMGRHAAIDQRGGVFLRRADQMSEEERELLLRAARVVLQAKDGSLARQLRRLREAAERHEPGLAAPIAIATTPSVPPPPPQGVLAKPSKWKGMPKAVPSNASLVDDEPATQRRTAPSNVARDEARSIERGSGDSGERPVLEFDNGLGGFGDGGREYVIRLGKGNTPPAPWCNVMAGPNFGSLVSESGASYTWFRNSQRYRLTPWSNDAVLDPSGELIYVREEDTKQLWSATPAPAGADVPFVVRHGRGYSHFEHERDGLRQRLTAFVGRTDDVKFWRLEIENRSGRARRLSVFGVVEWVLGQSREQTRSFIATNYDEGARILTAFNPLGAFPTHRAFLGSTLPCASYTADRASLFGSAGTRAAPSGLRQPKLNGAIGTGLDGAAALQLSVELAPAECSVLTFFLGQAESLNAAAALSARYSDQAAVDRAFDEAAGYWTDVLSQVEIRTPDRALDVMHNHWLLYQSLSSRIWGRTGFYQSSGAFGYRDQLQDVLALIHTQPGLAREQLLRCAAHQFIEGDVQHWWHEETGHGLRTRCSDDMLWLPYATAHYVACTGDHAVLDEQIPFLVERELSANEEDLFSAPTHSEVGASLYEHCVRALNAGTTSGPHGLPTMRGGDWNDGMNRVGHEGTGESVWLAWFLARTLLDFAEVAKARGDSNRERYCEECVKVIARAVEEHAWDGQWYRRAYFDDGTWLGSRRSEECCIDAIAQSWAVIAAIGSPDRAAQAVAASEERLISREHRLMQLLTPAFHKTQPDPGYIQSYPAGIRENGGQYTHGVLWTVLALTLLGEGSRAHSLLEILNPIRHGDTPEGVKAYAVEPYVVAADVYSGSGHEGRGGWTWYTGSAGWMYRIVLEHVLGVNRRGDMLVISPCIPSEWRSFEVDYRFGSSIYHISVENPEHVCHGVGLLEVDGRAQSGAQFELRDDGREHEVAVRLGRSKGARQVRAGVV